MVPPNGGTPTTTITDARGKTTELDQYTTSALTGPYQKTTYGYDAAGRLTSMHDSANNAWTYVYDLRGRMTESNDPDKGKTTTTYDDADQVTTTKDARNITLWYGYDLLGRKTAERLDNSAGALQAAWTYDTVAKGQLASSTRYVGASNAYVTAITSYDDAYQPKAETVTLPSSEGALAGTYTTTYAYTLDEQLKSITYPKVGGLPAETVTTVYDALSKPSWMTGGGAGGVYVASSTLSSYGDLLALDLGNTYSEYVDYGYEEGTRRLSSVALNRDGVAGDDVHANYTYDDAGNVTSIADTPTVAGAQNDTQCFAYDGLRRLTSAWTPSSGSCATSRAVAGLGGPAPYWTDYSYDSVGDRTSIVAHNPGGDTTAAYSYPTATATHPHAVSQVQTTAPGGGTTTANYGYDETGNTTSRPGSNGQQSLTWDAEGHLATDTDGGTVSSYTYDAAGNRLTRHQGSTVTAYLPAGQELTLDTSTNTVAGTRYYQFDGRTIAIRTGAGLAGVTSLVPDQHDTAIASVADTTNVLTVRRLDPFGNARGAKPTWPGDHGFLNDPADTSGLTHIGAREYDPALGRFISVDPLLNVGDPQQWSGYSYSNNNPTSFSDPTGLTLTPDNMTASNPVHESTPGTNDRLAAVGRSQAHKPASYTKPADVSTKVGKAIAYGVADAAIAIVNTPSTLVTYSSTHFGTTAPLWQAPMIPSLGPTDGGVYKGVYHVALYGAPLLIPGIGEWADLGEGGVVAAESAQTAARSAGAAGTAVEAGAAGASSASDHIVLGLKNFGLEATAGKVGGRTLLSDPAWQDTLRAAVANPSTKFTVSLDGMSGPSTYAQVMNAAQRGVAGAGGYTDWEMAQLYQAGRLSDTTFLRGGSVVENPFTP